MSHWQVYDRRWTALRAPLRPGPSVIEAVRSLGAAHSGPVLLLGVTPELADAFEMVQAVDKSERMIATLWPGDTETKQAVLGDWMEIPGPDGRFGLVVGDGSLNSVAYPGDLRRLLLRVRDLLAPGGRLVCRLFERPTEPFTLAELRGVASGPAALNFHAFKWMLAMWLAADVGASIKVVDILERFEALFPDRDALAARTGWPRADIDTIDVYRGSSEVYGFPDRDEWLAALPEGFSDARFHASGDYDLADRCPILACRKS